MTQDDWTKIKETLDKNPEKAFECLYNHLWDKLFSISLNYVRDQALAQEIVQDVFVTLWVKRKRLESVSNIRAFAMRAVQNRIYDHFDKEAVYQKYALRITQSESTQANSTQQQIEYNETFNLIDTEIDRLPDTTRKIFRLSRFDRFTNEEIAARLQLSVKAVEYHITQALKQLRLKLKYIGTVLLFLTGLH
jgi:RNA polymerase sigma-70 factor (ECF subfamily)